MAQNDKIPWLISIKVKVYLLLSQQINPVEQSRVRELYPTLGNKNKALLGREEVSSGTRSNAAKKIA